MFDADTKLGLRAKDCEKRAAKIFSVNTGFDVEILGGDGGRENGSPVDAAIRRKDGKLVGFAEVRSRGLVYKVTLDKLRNGSFRNHWLVSLHKIEALKRWCKARNVPGAGMLYLPSDDVLLVVKVCDPEGKVTCRMHVRTLATRATINGGMAVRENAFINMEDAVEYRIDGEHRDWIEDYKRGESERG